MFWENFFKNTINLEGIQAQTGLLQAITGVGVPAAMVYGFWPCALCLGIHYAPFAYILIGGILRNMDANLEEAATILKASRFKILRRITLPNMLRVDTLQPSARERFSSMRLTAKKRDI